MLLLVNIVILDGKGNKTIGVQVKRYKNSIRVSQIREFAGALIENDMTKGIFITTKLCDEIIKEVSDIKTYLIYVTNSDAVGARGGKLYDDE